MDKTGHCHCGAVSFVVRGEPLRMSQCHCNACRRTTGTGHNSAAFFRRADVSITGETKGYQSTADSGARRRRLFCPICGSRLFSENERSPDVLGIAAGAFDETSWFRPSVVFYSNERPVWDLTDPDIEHRERM